MTVHTIPDCRGQGCAVYPRCILTVKTTLFYGAPTTLELTNNSSRSMILYLDFHGRVVMYGQAFNVILGHLFCMLYIISGWLASFEITALY